MPESPVPSDVLRVGAFELDVRARELRHGQVRIRLQDQPFEILHVLLQRAGDIVTRDELSQRLWPDGTFVDFEHSLNAAIKRLRASLGDDANRPRFIETVPRRGYRFIAIPGDAADQAGVGAQAAEARIRVAVLPFTNLGAPEQELFCDGLTEELAVQLGRLGRRRIAVLARWSSTAFKGRARRAREIGEALRADYLLEGTVRREDDHVRITACLVETDSETHLWTDTYDERVGGDQLGLQVSVAERVAQSLRVELVRDNVPPAQPDSRSPAYQAYLKGRYCWNQLADSRLEEAITHFKRAVELEPRFAAAWASLACAHVAAAEYYRESASPALDAARRAASRGLELDPTSTGAHIAIGDVHRIVDWDWSRAEESYVAALSFNPSSDSAHRRLCLLLAALGRADEAEAAALRLRELDPLCLVVGSATAWSSYLSGSYEQAVERSLAVLEMDPQFGLARRTLAAALLALGRGGEAIAMLSADQVSGESADSSRARGGMASLISSLWLAHALAVSARIGDAKRLIEQVTRQDAHGFVPAYHLAIAYAGVGEIDAALAALERAFEQRDPALMQVGVEPRLRSLHGQPRLRALVERLHLPASLLDRSTAGIESR